MTTKRRGPGGAQPTDPPWARLLFVLVEGWEGQCRRALMLVMPLVLLAASLVGLLALLPGWISGSALGMGIGTLGAFAASRRRRRPR